MLPSSPTASSRSSPRRLGRRPNIRAASTCASRPVTCTLDAEPHLGGIVGDGEQRRAGTSSGAAGGASNPSGSGLGLLLEHRPEHVGEQGLEVLPGLLELVGRRHAAPPSVSEDDGPTELHALEGRVEVEGALGAAEQQVARRGAAPGGCSPSTVRFGPHVEVDEHVAQEDDVAGRARRPGAARGCRVSNRASERTCGRSTHSRPACSKYLTRYCAGRPRLTSSWEYRAGPGPLDHRRRDVGADDLRRSRRDVGGSQSSSSIASE